MINHHLSISHTLTNFFFILKKVAAKKKKTVKKKYSEIYERTRRRVVSLKQRVNFKKEDLICVICSCNVIKKGPRKFKLIHLENILRVVVIEYSRLMTA